MKIKNPLFAILLFAGISISAQPLPEFSLKPPTQRDGALNGVGYVTLDGLPASAGDYVAIFDPGYICSGIGAVMISGMNASFALLTYTDNPIEPNDGGINCTLINPLIPPYNAIGCEGFTLVYWKASTNKFYHYPTAASPTSLTYTNNNGNLLIDAMDNNPSINTFNFTGDPMNPALLPVELLFFRGAPKASDVLLEWATASEQNNDFFELQRSVDGREFEVLGKVPGAGTHSGLLTYEFTDRSPRPGVNYYRLRQVDFDGAFEYSSIISVKAAGKEGGMALYPNPAGEYVEVSLPADWSEGEKELLLRDVSGRVLRKMQYSNVDGPLRVSTEGLPGGYYTLQASNGREVLSERVVVMRQ